MTERNDNLYLQHISDAIKKIEEYAKGLDYKDFLQNTLVQDGIIRQIEIIGEATKNLSDATRNEYKNIPWKDIAGMRDKLIHDYFGVDIDAIWETVKTDIIELKSEIASILKP
ncbi:MAG: DUF86 domain-containing protein [bacterium]